MKVSTRSTPGILEGTRDTGRIRELRAEMRAIIRGAFGLTPVEGYSFGAPAIVLRSGGYLDSGIEGVTSVFVDRPSVQCLVDAVHELSDQEFDAEAIRAHGELFSLSAFRERVHSSIERVVAPN